jgi:hypothetical protein
MSYGKVISGGAKMSKGVSKGINDKLESRKKEDGRRAKVASAVKQAYTVNTVSSQHTNFVSNGGKFKKPSNKSADYAL